MANLSDIFVDAQHGNGRKSRPSEVAGRVTKDGVAPHPVDGAKIG
jgi:hypothetical protein